MLGIAEIGCYVPAGRVWNASRAQEFGVNQTFIEDKIGFRSLARMSSDENTAVLCVKAFEALRKKRPVDHQNIEAIIVVTQNPDRNIPHISAVVHGQLGLPQRCAAFDISLGCTGYVHGLSIALGFMASNKMRRGILLTADPYSRIVNPADRDTAMIFGDAASATYLTDEPLYVPGRFRFGTIGEESDKLAITNGHLHMNGRAIFNLVARNVPADVTALLADEKVALDEVDRFLFHPGSRYIVDTLIKSLRLPNGKVPFIAAEYGNTVSSSIPLLLQEELTNEGSTRVLLSGFGVGLSWASTLLRRRKG